MATTQQPEGVQDRRTKALEEYRKKLVEHRELDASLKKRKLLCCMKILNIFNSLSVVETHVEKIWLLFELEIKKAYCTFSVCYIVRENLRELSKEYDRSEDDLKALQSGVGQIVGEVLRQLTEDKCKSNSPV